MYIVHDNDKWLIEHGITSLSVDNSIIVSIIIIMSDVDLNLFFGFECSTQ